ncbi:MAG TPA: UDP-N-acetylmuramoyl-L-alanyl-D-glutamate--2,6-diaminopimelate ligase [Allosphingosinicella sp.]|jgi:UDP-N-acetylmuramoyl-L-alanyl-D-glutamate--2,6-diaminopimelate ligase
MKLSTLCDDWDVVAVSRDPGELVVFDATDNSRHVHFGSVFCARPATTAGGEHGWKYCAQAARNGAQAIVLPPDADPGLSDYEQGKIVVVRVRDVAAFFARLVARFHPGRPATIAAVTGTNGKTSTVNFLRDLWAAQGLEAVSIGTLGIRARHAPLTDLEATLTTFDPKTQHMMLEILATRHGVTHAAIEASSHALDQQRLAGLDVDLAAFTNLTQDHLDYHGTMDRYFEAKLLLFEQRLKADGTAVVNVTAESGERIAAAAARRGIRIVTYSPTRPDVDLRVISVDPHQAGQRLALSVFGTAFNVDAPIAGRFQAENILCAIGLAIASGVDADAAVAAVAQLSSVPGRMELAALLANGASVYVDYAHTDDALRNALASLRPHVRPGSKLAVVFGCGGDRDAGKRPLMGSVARKAADRQYVTDDNPRTEDAAAIRRAVMAAAGAGAVDVGGRREAIERAMSDLEPGDVLLVAGKGHEDYQIVPKLGPDGQPVRDERGVVTHKQVFSDLEVVRNMAGA